MLHCYAIDCASHFLFNPRGLNTLGEPKDLAVLHGMIYHDSIQREHASIGDLYNLRLTDRFQSV